MHNSPRETAELNPTENYPARQSAGYRSRLALYAIVSLLLAIPCFWQPHIQADDLSSHLYNAWLVSEVSSGRLPGLYVAPQFTNVLFDHLLSLLMKTANVLLAERVAVLLAVQIFFWGCFRLASAAVGRPAWTAVPFLALAAYGVVFRMGFFNFYLSVGICALAIALFWLDHPRFRWASIPLLALAYLAHFIPCLWAIGVIGYVYVARRLRPSRRPWLAALGLVCIAGVALFLARNVASRWAPGLRIDSMLGTDQVLTFGLKYRLVAAVLLCLWILLLVRRFEMPPSMLEDLPFQLLVLNAAATLCMPDAIWFPQQGMRLTYIAIRLSLFSAILLCVVIARARMNALEKVMSGALLVLFFSFAYVDERSINSIETKMVRAIANLPLGSRVIATVHDSRSFVPPLEHMLDRACIGRCFDFANYEPATTQFRLRAEPGNLYVMTNIEEILALEQSEYVWRRRDIELYRLQPCQARSDICVTLVQPGERLMKQQLNSVPTWWRGE